MNRGARGWEPPKKEVVKEYFEATEEKRTIVLMDEERVIDLIEHNGTWMTKEDAKR